MPFLAIVAVESIVGVKYFITNRTEVHFVFSVASAPRLNIEGPLAHQGYRVAGLAISVPLGIEVLTQGKLRLQAPVADIAVEATRGDGVVSDFGRCLVDAASILCCPYILHGGFVRTVGDRILRLSSCSMSLLIAFSVALLDRIDDGDFMWTESKIPGDVLEERNMCA